MISAIIRACIENRAMVIVLTAALVFAGVWSARTIRVDAIPALSDVQVIIRTEFPGQAPQLVEDQVTYPLTSTMLAVPGAKTVRGFSMFGSSFISIIFDDGTDLYWARARVLERLSTAASLLPDGVTRAYGHTGDSATFHAELMFVPGERAVVLLANRGGPLPASTLAARALLEG